jgi:hypothetical protein
MNSIAGSSNRSGRSFLDEKRGVQIPSPAAILQTLENIEAMLAKILFRLGEGTKSTFDLQEEASKVINLKLNKKSTKGCLNYGRKKEG